VKKDGNCHILADACWEMLLMLLESHLKGIGKPIRGIRKPLGNAQIPVVSQ
jgi:hypothetical protein